MLARVPLLVLLATLGSSARARADLATRAEGSETWGRLKVALTVFGHEDGRLGLIFALYSNGQVLYAQPGDYGYENYQSVMLTPTEQQALIGDLPIGRVGDLHPPKRMGADGATECIHIWSGTTHKQDCLWGGIEDDFGGAIPDGMVKIWKRLAHFTSSRAQRWLPDRIFVRLSRFPTAPSCGFLSPSKWPARWPRPAQPGTSKTRSGEWTLLLPGSALPEFKRIDSAASSGGCRQPVSIDGVDYSVEHRFALPDEQAWNPRLER
ncbi:MAG: hypothetical protein ACXVRV_05635 [Gaiellaceae bacterium]